MPASCALNLKSSFRTKSMKNFLLAEDELQCWCCNGICRSPSLNGLPINLGLQTLIKRAQSTKSKLVSYDRSNKKLKSRSSLSVRFGYFMFDSTCQTDIKFFPSACTFEPIDLLYCTALILLLACSRSSLFFCFKSDLPGVLLYGVLYCILHAVLGNHQLHFGVDKIIAFTLFMCVFGAGSFIRELVSFSFFLLNVIDSSNTVVGWVCMWLFVLKQATWK